MTFTGYHAKYFAYELTKAAQLGSIERYTAVFQDTQVDLNQHQIKAALFAFKNPLSRGVIVADEVGLGKTIEAGIVIAQKWSDIKRHIIVIVPATLRHQWQIELEEKFYLPSIILDKSSFDKCANNGEANPFCRDEIVITSYHFASSRAEYLKQVAWDLVVIDEAHRLRNVYKGENVMAKNLKAALTDSFKVLLTATPLQNSLLELYGLVSFIDNIVFGDLESFKEQFSTLRNGQAALYDDLSERLKSICIRTLRRQVLEYINTPTAYQ